MKKVFVFFGSAAFMFAVGLGLVGVINAQPIVGPARESLGGGVGGAAYADVDMHGYEIYDSVTPLNLGTAAGCSSGHSLAASADVIDCGKLEVDGATYLDSTAAIAGAATFSSTIDAESYMALGNGSALESNRTLLIDRDFSSTDGANQLYITGDITVTGGTSNLHISRVYPSGTIINSGGVHPIVTSLNIDEPVITLSSGSCTTSATERISAAATECGTNYALWVDSGTSQFDGNITSNGNITTSGYIGSSSTNEYALTSSGGARTGSDDGYGFSSDVGGTSSMDTGIWRDSAGAVAFGDGNNSIGKIVIDPSAFTKGQRFEIEGEVESVTFSAGGDASKATTGSLLQKGSRVLFVTGRVTTAGTTCSGFNVGVSGGTDDIWGADIAVAQNTTFGGSNYTAQWNPLQLADGEVVITGTDGAGTPTNCVDMVVAITVVREVAVAATSN